MNVTARINKVIKTLGLMGIMMALAGFLAASTSPASAASLTSSAGSGLQPMPRIGEVVVYAEIEGSTSALVPIEVVIFDAWGNGVTKGVIYNNAGKFSAQLVSGDYKVQVLAKGYTTHYATVKIEPNMSTTVKAGLVPLSDPVVYSIPVPASH